MITSAIHRLLEPAAIGSVVEEVRIGLGYTAVLLDSGHAGLAYTPRDGLPAHCSAFPGAGRLAGRAARELLAYLGAPTPLERAVGLATANALAPRPLAGVVEGDVLAAISLSGADRVGMVGHFAPLVPAVRTRVASLTVFEKSNHLTAGMQPATCAVEILPECTVALITSTILLDPKPDVLLQAAAKCREVVLLGPSTPLVPEAFASTAVTWLSGVAVTSPLDLLRVVSEGGGTRDFGRCVRRVSVRVPPGRAEALDTGRSREIA